jgi:energy-coupling factor transporter ATP-binding protein EcfA2
MAFQETDAAIYFGRGEDISKTLDTLDALRRGREAGRFLLMLGASGSGKSSLVRAGIIPRLKKKPTEWLPVPPFRPQSEPLEELAVALATAFGAAGDTRDQRSEISAKLRAAAESPINGGVLLDLARDLSVRAQQPEATVLLTIDQAEELFGYCPTDKATSFLRLLRAALETADRRLMAIATLRSDFLGEFQTHPALQQDRECTKPFHYANVRLGLMPMDSFPEIIEGPAKFAGLELGAGLVDAMVKDTGTADALPLLAFTLLRL